MSGCGFDEPLERNQQHDGDDINVIQDIWPQALDKMLRWIPSSKTSTSSLATSSSIAQWLDQRTQLLSVDDVPVVLPKVSDQLPSQPSPQLSDQTLPPDSSGPILWNASFDRENESDQEDD